MCGIAGFIGRGTTQDLRRMMAALRHRGPDAEGEWQDASRGVYLAVTRLAILDQTRAAQPMRTPNDELVLAYNGEIYNHADLRHGLEQAGAAFTTHHSDTEVVLHGYRHWGESVTSHLDGMWAFAIHDASRRAVVLSRDRFGQKPLYYSCQNGTFAFASELTALVGHERIRASVAASSVRKYFAYGFIPAPHSLYAGVHKLPAGCSLTIDTATLEYRVTRYWDYVLDPDDSPGARDVPTACERLRALVDQAVRRQCRSDVPLGVFLSGGLDSSAIARVAAEVRPAIETFSIGFEHPAFDESTQARRVSSLLGTNHTGRTLSRGDAPATLDRLAARLDEPIGDSSLLCTHLLCETARARVTVALGGEGADELFGGYDPFRALSLAGWYARLTPAPVHRAIRLVAARLPSRTGYMPFDFRLNRLLRGLSYRQALWNPVWIGPLEPAELRDCLEDSHDIDDVYAEAIELWDRWPHLGPVERTLQFYARLYLQDDILAKVDRAGMMHSLEVRSPFLDADLVEFARRLPTDMKLRGGQTKFLLKEAMRPLLPPWIVDQRKHGFAVPMAEWIREGWFAPDTARLPRAVRPEFVRRKLAAHRRGTENNAIFLWSAWVLAQTTHAQPVD